MTIPVKNDLKLNNFTINLQNIEQIILSTQKKIYISSKYCKINSTHRIQMSIFKNKYYRFLFIKQIIKDINSKTSLNHDYGWKMLLYIYLSVNIHIKKSIFLNYIKQRLYQNLIFFVLQPEWDAKFEKFTNIQQSNKYCNKLHERLNKFFKYPHITSKNVKAINIFINIPGKSIDFKCLIKKIQSIDLIIEKLSIFFNLYKFIDYNYRYANTQLIKYNDLSNKLYKLLKSVLNLGIEWHLYTNFKTKNMYNNFIVINNNEIMYNNLSYIIRLKTYLFIFANKLNLDYTYFKYKKVHKYKKIISLKDIYILKQSNKLNVVKISSNSIKLLFRNIRSILYKKNNLNQWRIKRYLKAEVAKSKIERYIHNYIYFLDYKQILKCQIIINTIFHIWQTKK
uniref:Reverse transcriptase N-terminal domain-containing protein n=1 Tax=Synarthrophyton chejuense TaxID=2485825 RepID=A0A3G3MFJ5_9FLOR|nr:hypothetical protein [Synarthrophyton chejuense]AYR05591.1 hypothetical protein [Synarthrophyton chejuense]